MSKKKDNQRSTDYAYLLSQNNYMFREYRRLRSYYRNIALNLYKWHNLPGGIESRHIEKFLYEKGQVFFTKDKEFGFIALPCTVDDLNVYGDPQRINVNLLEVPRKYHATDGVRILNNDTAQSTERHIEWYAKRMAHLESVMMQNLQQQRLPYVIGTTEETHLSMKRMLDNVQTGASAIYVDREQVKNVKDNVCVFPTTAPYLLDRLQQEKQLLEKELLTFLGINTTIEKKERLLVDETNANNGFIEMNLNLGLQTRQRACDLINEMYHLTGDAQVKVTATMHEFNQFDKEERDGEVDGNE